MGKIHKTKPKASAKSRAKKAASGGIAKASAKALSECPRKSGAGSIAHRDQRWKEYAKRPNGWTKERWEKTYWANMVKASESRKAVEKYQKTLDPSWKELEVSVTVPKDTNIEGKETRRLDIADNRDNPTKAIEHKTGYICLSVAIQSEADRDAYLVTQGMDITWHFEDRGGKEPSKQLLEYLKKRGIKITKA